MATSKKAALKKSAAKPAPAALDNPVLENVEFFPNNSAHPTNSAFSSTGLSKRELLAGTIIGHIYTANPNFEPQTLVQEAVNLATLVLAECARTHHAEMAVTIEFEEEKL